MEDPLKKAIREVMRTITNDAIGVQSLKLIETCISTQLTLDVGSGMIRINVCHVRFCFAFILLLFNLLFFYFAKRIFTLCKYMWELFIIFIFIFITFMDRSLPWVLEDPLNLNY